MTEFYVKVRPGSEEFRIEEAAITRVFLEEPADNGRANSELVRRLSDVLGKKPAIVSGHHSRRKKLRVDMEEGKARERLEGF